MKCYKVNVKMNTDYYVSADNKREALDKFIEEFIFENSVEMFNDDADIKVKPSKRDMCDDIDEED